MTTRSQQSTYQPTANIDTLRNLYAIASTDESACNRLLLLTDSNSRPTPPIIAGYHGAATAISAKYLFSPLKKISCFRKGTTILDKTLLMNDQNAELHFIRYTIQANCPLILGYHQHVARDREFLLQYLKTATDEGLKRMIQRYPGLGCR